MYIVIKGHKGDPNAMIPLNSHYGSCHFETGLNIQKYIGQRELIIMVQWMTYFVFKFKISKMSWQTDTQSTITNLTDERGAMRHAYRHTPHTKKRLLSLRLFNDKFLD